MATYLLTWNPARWPWHDLQEDIQEVIRAGYCSEPWNSGVTKKIESEDRVFLMKLGDPPRGIMASGWATSGVFEAEHWDVDRARQGKTALYVDVHFDTILDPAKKLFGRERLVGDVYSKMHWEPHASGTTIPDDVATMLESDWARWLNRPTPFRQLVMADEVDTEKSFMEGATKRVTVSRYERSAEARTIAINRHGLDCQVCGFNFADAYGKIGDGFIHVHHRVELAKAGKQYRLNPVADLCPVCPNCHAMLHQRKPAYSIEELKSIIEAAKS